MFWHKGLPCQGTVVVKWMTFTLMASFMYVKVKAAIKTFPPPCSGIPTVNLLDRAVPLVRDLPAGVSVVYEKSSHVHAYKFSGDTSDIHLQSSRIFHDCLYFPYEFSLFITLKLDMRPRKEQCVFSLYHETSKDRLISFGIVGDRMIFRYKGKRFQFKMSQGYEYRKWHTFGISMAADVVSFTRDCQKRRRRPLRMSFPDLLPVTNTTFTFGRCKEESSVFQGLLKSVIFVSGGDAAAKACPDKVPLRGGKGFENVIRTFPGYTPLTGVSTRPVTTCEWSDVGTIAFDVHVNKLKVCVNGVWRKVRVASDRRRLDYLVLHQTITTSQWSLDVEVFDIRKEGKFAVFATGGVGASRSGLYRWEDDKFVFYQHLRTNDAQSWEFFEIRKQFFLAVANYGSDSATPTNSTIYRWSPNRRKFRPYQQIVTHTARDIEAFTIDGDNYIAVANHAKGNNTKIDSVIYKWSRTDRKFVEFQRLASVGAYDWTYFTVDDGYHFLALANTFTGTTTLVSSVLYFWKDTHWVQFQTMETNGATDWEHFTIEGDHYLAVANAFNFGSQNIKKIDSYRVDSTIYKLDRGKRVFVKYQTIPTNSAVDWEYMQIGADHYLLVSNSQNGGTGSRLRSVLYRWQGLDKFVRVHSLHTLPNADFEMFKVKDQVYLISSNAKGLEAQVLKVKFV